MILNLLITYLCNFLIWVSSLFPTWHISTSFPAFVSGITGAWTMAYTWSGVIPISTVLDIMGFVISLIAVFLVFYVVMIILNLIRGSGA